MSDELRQVGNGFSRRVNSFTIYDVNGYRFRTRSYEESRPNRKTTCYGVRTPGTDEKDYYGIVEEIYELNFVGPKDLKPVVFKCHWFDPDVTRIDRTIGQVEIRQDSIYKGEDVYIVANHHATQVYYLPWACQKDKKLAGWYLVQLVSPRGKAPVPNDDDYNFDPSTGTEEFYQPEGLEGTLEIDILSLMDMEVDNDIDEDEGDEVRDAKDLEILEQWRMVRDGVVEADEDDEEAGDDDPHLRELDNIDSDDDNSDSDDGMPAIAIRGDNF